MTTTANSIKLPSIRELTGSSNIDTLALPSTNSSENTDNGSRTPMYVNANYTSSDPNSFGKSNSPSWNSRPLYNLPLVPYEGTHTESRPMLPTYNYLQPSSQFTIPQPPPQQHQQPPPRQQQQQVYYYFPPSTPGLQQNQLPNPTFYSLPEVITKPVHRCHRCGTTETPEWRRGPKGARTLCNACGLVHTKLVKKKGAALAAEEVLNNKVWRGKNGRRISIKKYLMKEGQKNNNFKSSENGYGGNRIPSSSLILGNIPPQAVPLVVGNSVTEQQRMVFPPHSGLTNTSTYYPQY
ncbi:Biofilm regulator 1 [Spathaspora sp. JA1]|nr:Biofilm regulator 1 [Spathaspora sp. JA1]